jgi:hypothetical protein
MIGGAITVLCLYLCGIMGWMPDQKIGAMTKFHPYFLLGFEPLIWGLLVSIVSGVFVSFVTKPLDESLISLMFDRQPMKAEE